MNKPKFNNGICKETCNCIEIAEYENGGNEVKNYECLADKESRIDRSDSSVNVEAEVDVKIAKVIRETMEEIKYWHSDLLTEEERNHPRGSGWARVYDKLENIIKDSNFSD